MGTGIYSIPLLFIWLIVFHETFSIVQELITLLVTDIFQSFVGFLYGLINKSVISSGQNGGFNYFCILIDIVYGISKVFLVICNRL